MANAMTCKLAALTATIGLLLLLTSASCGDADSSSQAVRATDEVAPTVEVPRQEVATLEVALETPTAIATVTSTPAPTRTPRPRAAPISVTPRLVSLPPGEEAKDFKLTLLDGEELVLSDLKGKVVVLNFWASWCGPCRAEMPAFERIWQEYRERDVVFVGVAVSDVESYAREFAKKLGVTYALGIDDTGDISRDYRVVTLPTTYFIDRDGNVSRRLVSMANEGMLRIFLKGQLQ